MIPFYLLSKMAIITPEIRKRIILIPSYAFHYSGSPIIVFEFFGKYSKHLCHQSVVSNAESFAMCNIYTHTNTGCEIDIYTICNKDSHVICNVETIVRPYLIEYNASFVYIHLVFKIGIYHCKPRLHKFSLQNRDLSR